MASTWPRNIVATAALPAGGTISLPPFIGQLGSVAFWIELSDDNTTVSILRGQSNIPPCIYLNDGLLNFNMAGGVTLKTNTRIPRGRHYVVITVSDTVLLYINNALVWSQKPVPPLEPLAGNLILGGANINKTAATAPVNIWSISLYDVVLDATYCGPNWTPGELQPAPWTLQGDPPVPTQPPMPPRPVAEYFFGTVPAVETISNTSIPLTSYNNGVAQIVQTPCNLFPGGAWITPAPQARIAPVSSAYTIQASIYLNQVPSEPTEVPSNPPPVPPGSRTIFGFGQADPKTGSGGVRLMIAPLTGSTSECRLIVANGSDVVTATAYLQTLSWHNVAATYDGTTLTVFVDGAATGMTSSPVTLNAATSIAVGATPVAGAHQFDDLLTGCLVQTVDLWNRALTAAELTTYTQTLPVTTDESSAATGGCLASFDLGRVVSVDMVTQTQLLSYNGPVATNLRFTSPAATVANAAPAAAAASRGRLLPPDTVPETPRRPVTDQDIEAALAALAGMLPRSLNGKARAAFLADHKRQMRAVQAHLNAGGRVPGLFTVGRDGDRFTLLFNDVDGVREVLRFAEDTNECGVWQISVAATLLFGILSMFGVSIGSATVSKAVARFFSRFPLVAEAAMGMLQGEVSTRTVVAFVQTLYTSGAFLTFLGYIVASFSWLDGLLILGNLTLDFLALVFPTPYSAIWYALMLGKLAILAISLAVVVNARPPGCGTTERARIGRATIVPEHG